jgi:hypothetical membrane protein
MPRALENRAARSEQVPWWARVSSAAAPILLIGGWTLAAGRQPVGYSPLRDTISALAASGAHDRWIMTSALAGLGVCHCATALGLRPARRGGRVILGLGGIATVLVACFAQPERGNSPAHTAAAGIAFTALALWPVLAATRSTARPLLGPRISIFAATVMLGLVVWFISDDHSAIRGLAERAAAGTQSLWPLAVVLSPPRRAERPLAKGRVLTEAPPR